MTVALTLPFTLPFTFPFMLTITLTFTSFAVASAIACFDIVVVVAVHVVLMSEKCRGEEVVEVDQ